MVLAIALGTNLRATHALAATPDGLLSAPTAIDYLIQTAGTTHDELERLRLLRQLDARPDLNTALRADLARLLPVVDDWANGNSRVRHGLSSVSHPTRAALLAAQRRSGVDRLVWRVASGFLTDALSKYRLLTGDPQYDDLLRGNASGYVRCRLTGDPAALESALRRNAEAIRSTWEAYTSEMRWTDRVISFTGNYLNYLPEPAPLAPSPEILYSSATGDPGNPLVFPLNAVCWQTLPREFAALVTESTRTSFTAELFHFGARPRDLDPELFLRSPGEYELTLNFAGAEKELPLQRRVVRVEGPRVRVSVQLPARRLCVVKMAAR